MLKFQIALIAILIACVTFVSCDRQQQALAPVVADIVDADDMADTDDMMTAADMMDMMTGMMVDMTAHKAWANVGLPGPVGSGTAHGMMGARTVYVNDIGVMANKEGAAYPAGTVIVKEVMDDANAFVMTVATMMKTADPMYADHNGWMYLQFQRPSADGDYAPAGGGSLEGSTACHGCHAKAANDSVFISLSTGGMMDAMPETDADAMPETDADAMPETDADTMPETDADAMPEADAGDMGNGAGVDAGMGAGMGAGNGNGAAQ